MFRVGLFFLIKSSGKLDSVASGPGSSPGRGHCAMFLGKTIYSHGASLHPGVLQKPGQAPALL